MKNYLSGKPQQISKTDWYYEESAGISVIHEVRDKGTDRLIRVDTIDISWRKIRASLRRKDKKDAIKGRPRKERKDFRR